MAMMLLLLGVAVGRADLRVGVSATPAAVWMAAAGVVRHNSGGLDGRGGTAVLTTAAPDAATINA